MRRIAATALVGLVLSAAAPAQDGGDEAPSLELLEYLGEFEDGTGAWLDPELLLEMLGDTDEETEAGDDG